MRVNNVTSLGAVSLSNYLLVVVTVSGFTFLAPNFSNILVYFFFWMDIFICTHARSRLLKYGKVALN